MLMWEPYVHGEIAKIPWGNLYLHWPHRKRN